MKRKVMFTLAALSMLVEAYFSYNDNIIATMLAIVVGMTFVSVGVLKP